MTKKEDKAGALKVAAKEARDIAKALKAEKKEADDLVICSICGFPFGGPGEIPVIKYENEEDGIGPYVDGTRPCDHPRHKK